jgi:hypothetical protein
MVYLREQFLCVSPLGDLEIWGLYEFPDGSVQLKLNVMNHPLEDGLAAVDSFFPLPIEFWGREIIDNWEG